MNAATAERFGKLLRLLSSDKDGEILAAVSAIKRTLENEKLDIHALADAITAGVGSQPIRRENREPSWHDVAEACAVHAERLRPNEQNFVRDMVRRTVHGGEPTEKQAAWLRSIYARCRKW